MGNSIFIHERLAKKDVIIEKKARELDIHYKIKKSHLWAFDGERYQPVDDISELPDYQRRQQKRLQTVQNGTPFMNNKRTYAFSPDMDATNNEQKTKYVRCFISAKQKLCIKKLTFTVLPVNIRSLNKHL